MAILASKGTPVAVYGIAGRYGAAQVKSMQAAGTHIVAGVSVGGGGQILGGVPVFDTMAEAVSATGAEAGIVYVPAAGCLDAVVSCVDAGLRTIMAAAEFVPLHDTLQAAAYARAKEDLMIGPNTVGMISPGHISMGSFPEAFTLRGRVGVVSRSGTLNINTARLLTRRGIGQSTCVHIGGDYICGRNPSEYFDLFEQDDETDLVVYCGEIGGTKEYDVIDRLRDIKKPVVALIVGHASPREKRLGHAGAMILSDRDTAQAKREALQAAGVHIVTNLPALIDRVAELVPPQGRQIRNKAIA